MIVAASPAAGPACAAGRRRAQSGGNGRRRFAARRRPPRPAAAFAPPGAATVVGRTLLLNGANGQLQFSGRRRRLADRSVDAARRGHFGLRRSNAGSTSAAARRSRSRASGGPTACCGFRPTFPPARSSSTFSTGRCWCRRNCGPASSRHADCQASPSGLWGPAGAALQTDAKPIEQARALARRRR